MTSDTTAHQNAEDDRYEQALDHASVLLGRRLETFLDPRPGEPANRAHFKRLATVHTFGDSWSREEHLDTRTRALVSVTIAATLGTREPLRGQLRIALNSGATPEEIVETFIHGRGVRWRCPRLRLLRGRPAGVRGTGSGRRRRPA